MSDKANGRGWRGAKVGIYDDIVIMMTLTDEGEAISLAQMRDLLHALDLTVDEFGGLLSGPPVPIVAVFPAEQAEAAKAMAALPGLEIATEDDLTRSVLMWRARRWACLYEKSALKMAEIILDAMTAPRQR